uniref:Uncharacterized protein n=1 Tax=Oryza brachyantha TaxID=4533 RepID=J3MAF9_ORYBR
MSMATACFRPNANDPLQDAFHAVCPHRRLPTLMAADCSCRTRSQKGEHGIEGGIDIALCRWPDTLLKLCGHKQQFQTKKELSSYIHGFVKTGWCSLSIVNRDVYIAIDLGLSKPLLQDANRHSFSFFARGGNLLGIVAPLITGLEDGIRQGPELYDEPASKWNRIPGASRFNGPTNLRRNGKNKRKRRKKMTPPERVETNKKKLYRYRPPKGMETDRNKLYGYRNYSS